MSKVKLLYFDRYSGENVTSVAYSLAEQHLFELLHVRIAQHGIVNLFVEVGIIAELERGNIFQSGEKLGRGNR